ncbi:MAG: response regulator [Myxococcales bacterium]|nr:response regulator [Myxococcales bacterium]
MRDEGFALEVQEASIHGFRRAVYLAIILIPSFGILDAISLEDAAMRNTFWVIRAGVAVILITLLRIALRPAAHRYVHAITMFGIFIAGGSISLMSAMFGGHESYYYAGMNLVLLAVGVLIPFGPLRMLTSASLVYLAYVLLTLWLDPTPPDEWKWNVFLNNMIFCVGTGAVVTLGAYVNTYLRRKAFDARFEQDRANDELRLVNKRLQSSYAEISDKNRELEEAYRVKSQFLDNMSHELRTPLTCILTPLEGLLGGNVRGELRQILEDMNHAARQLYDLINDLLDYSRYGERDTPLHLARIDLCELVNRHVRIWVATARQRELTLRWERPDAPLPIWADAKELGKVVRNLISNAVKFTPAGGEVEILLEAPQASGEVDWVQLSVRDTGIGMDEDAQRKIFKPFFQADSSSTRAFEGTGIGLALVKAIVVRHEGEIAVASKPGVGTTMTVTLPRAPAEAEKLAQLEGAAEAELAELPDAEARFSSPSQAIYVDDDAYEDEEPESVGPVLEVLEGGAASRPDDASIPIPEATRLVQEHVDREIFRRARIVLIDDQPNILRLLERILSPHHDVVTADDGAAGLARVLETRPNLVISDVMMPRMNGFQLVHELRSNPTTERIPVLLLTARADGSDRVRGLRGGANDYLVKPFEPAELKARVRNLLRQHYYETYLTRLNEELDTKSSSLESRVHGLFIDTVKTLVAAIDAKDYYTGGHSERVSYFAVKLGEHMKLPRPAVRTIELGALLHDVGKIGIPDRVLNKPGRLTGEEIEIIRKHTVFGARILEKSPELSELRRFALSHHERWDGTGYPEGLRGDDIPQSVRVVSVADCWDAMVSDRVYRPGMEPEVAAGKIARLGATQFDPAIVEALQETWRDLELPSFLRPLRPRAAPREHRAAPRVSECGEVYHVHED